MELNFKKVDLPGLHSVAQKVAELTQTIPLVLFYGHMGAGKTTFINVLCQALNVTDETSSPTFSIVNEYATKDKKSVFHFDFYRLKSESEAFDLGYEDYLYSGNVCLIEWPERIVNLLPDEVIEFHIEGMGDVRDIKIM